MFCLKEINHRYIINATIYGIIMSQKEKLIERFLRKPAPKDITFDEFCSVMAEFSFQKVPMNGGSHQKFKNTKYPDIKMDSVPKPHGGNNCVKRSYVENAQAAIHDFQRRENDNE